MNEKEISDYIKNFFKDAGLIDDSFLKTIKINKFHTWPHIALDGKPIIYFKRHMKKFGVNYGSDRIHIIISPYVIDFFRRAREAKVRERFNEKL